MTAVSLEAGEGELSLDDPVSDYWEGPPRRSSSGISPTTLPA